MDGNKKFNKAHISGSRFCKGTIYTLVLDLEQTIKSKKDKNRQKRKGCIKRSQGNGKGLFDICVLCVLLPFQVKNGLTKEIRSDR